LKSEPRISDTTVTEQSKLWSMLENDYLELRLLNS
jgi:hypothetical protein